MEDKETLRWYLQRKDNKLYRKFASIVDDLKPILNRANQRYYSDHGEEHCKNVEKNLDELLPKKIKNDMPPEEIFCLLLSIWFHDIGLIVEMKEEEPYKERRATHSERTYNYIHQNYEYWRLDEPYAFAIKEICYAHSGSIEKMKEISQSPIIIGRSYVRTKFLAGLLRIADELDIGFWKVPAELLRLWKVPEQEMPFLLKDRLTSGIKIDPDLFEIRINLLLKEKDREFSDKIEEMIEKKIKNELICLRETLRENNLGYRDVDIIVTNFGLPKTAIPEEKPSPPKIIPENPYISGVPIREPEDFFGRQEEIKRIIMRLNKGESSSIIGPRKIGKTSLLYQLIHPSKLKEEYGVNPEEYIFAFIDLQGKREYTEAEMVNLFSTQIGRKENKASFESLAKGLKGLKNNGQKTVFILDEFENMCENKKITSNFYGNLRSLNQAFLCSYVTTSMKSLADLTDDKEIKDSPFFNIFESIYLGVLTMEEAKDLIVLPAKRRELIYLNTLSLFWVIRVITHFLFKF
ncbi:MAG: hypothetical protein AB1422_03500 [bacterium]